jgi:hypothetical protein
VEGRRSERRKDAMLLALSVEEGAGSNRLKNVFGSWKQENKSLPTRASRKNAVLQIHFIFLGTRTGR